MPLTSEQMEQITVELLTGKESTITGEEADKFRAELQPEIDRITASGRVVEIPTELKV